MFCFLFVRVCDLLQQPNEMSSNIPVIDTNSESLKTFVFIQFIAEHVTLYLIVYSGGRQEMWRERGHATNVHGWIQTSDFVIMKNEFQATRPLRCSI